MPAVSCKACLLTCMDFRLHEGLNRFFADQGLDLDGADVVRVAGAAKGLSRPEMEEERQFLLKQLALSHALHSISRIYLINHEDCGAYGLRGIPDSQEELAIHIEDLRRAEAVVQERLPGCMVSPCFEYLDGRVEIISSRTAPGEPGRQIDPHTGP